MDLLTKEGTPSMPSVSSVFRSQPRLKLPQSGWAEARPAIRSPTSLHLHQALERVGWTGLVEEFNDAARSASRSLQDPISIATDGTILAGFGRWRLAVFEQLPEIDCIEHPLSADDALAFILSHHQTQRGWNAFVRIRLALTLKPSLQQAALNNMRLGGKYKGLANLPEVQHIDVRKQVADKAGVCARNVANVETILKIAHPTLIEALTSGTLKINGALQFCKAPQAEQLTEFMRSSEERAISKVIRRSLVQPQKDGISIDPCTVIEALHNREELRSGSVLVRIGRHKRTVIQVGQDLLAEIYSQKELQLK
jgi:hypothetical protein